MMNELIDENLLDLFNINSNNSNQDDYEHGLSIKHDYYNRITTNNQINQLQVSLLQTHHSLWAEFIYNAAKVLADMIDNHEINCKGKKCLELGAGAGLPSLIICLNDCNEMIISDYGLNDDLMLIDVININIDYIKPYINTTVNVIGIDYIWGKSVDRLLKPNESFSSNLFDIIICADLIFNRSEHKKLLWTIKHTLDKEGIAYISFSHHDPLKKQLDLNIFNLAIENNDEYGNFIVTKIAEIIKPCYPFIENDGLDDQRGVVYIYTLKHKLD